MTLFALLIGLLTLNQPQNMIIFYNIDDYVTLEVNGQIIYQNDTNDNAPNIYKEVNLDKYLKKGSNKVVIRLKNAGCSDCPDNPWSLGFEIHQNGEYVDDFFRESKKKSQLGAEKIFWEMDWIKE